MTGRLLVLAAVAVLMVLALLLARREPELEGRWIDEGDDGLPPADPRLL